MPAARQRAQLSPETYVELIRAAPVALMVIQASDLVMVDANQRYLDYVGLERSAVVGRAVFDVFPNSPLDVQGDQGSDLAELFSRAIATRERVVEGLRYDIPNGDGFDVRWWNVIETPVTDDSGEVAYLLHFTEDVTDLRLAQADLLGAQQAQQAALQLLSGLAEVALSFSDAQTIQDLQRIVVERGLTHLGVTSGALLTRDDHGAWHLTASDSLDARLREKYSTLAQDSALPIAVCARTGQRILLNSPKDAVRTYPAMEDVYAHIDRSAFACLPLVSRGRRLGAMSMSWTGERHLSGAELEMLGGFAAQCATALDRIEQDQEQRRATEQIRHLAEALQSAMLTPPPRTEEIELAVRYRPASDVARVGGDWYDAFVQPGGDLMIVIGDVSGHDDVAAGAMGQARGLLRALAYDDDRRPVEGPAEVLSRFEVVARGLEVDELSTAVLARICRDFADGGGREVVWSNAGNPPPVLLLSDGSTILLDRADPDLLLGVDPDTLRHDLSARLPPGSTLLLYTDGLIERRDASIDVGLDDLRNVLSDLPAVALATLCDQVLARLDPHIGEDDIAMVAVRV